MLRSGVLARRDIRLIGDGGIRERLSQIGVLPHELGDAAGAESGPVGPDEELPVDVRTGSDTDGRNFQFFRDAGCRVCG